MACAGGCFLLRGVLLGVGGLTLLTEPSSSVVASLGCCSWPSLCGRRAGDSSGRERPISRERRRVLIPEPERSR